MPTTLSAQECRMARAAVGLGVRELAERADVSPNTVARLERGEALHRRTQAHIRGVLEAQGAFFVGDPGSGHWPGPIVGYAKDRALSGRAKLQFALWERMSLRLDADGAYSGLLDLFADYLTIRSAEDEALDLWECFNLNLAAGHFDRSDVYSAYICLCRAMTPPDNQAAGYPISDKDAAFVADCDLVYFRRAIASLRSKACVARADAAGEPA